MMTVTDLLKLWEKKTENWSRQTMCRWKLWGPVGGRSVSFHRGTADNVLMEVVAPVGGRSVSFHRGISICVLNFRVFFSCTSHGRSDEDFELLV